MLSCGYCSKIFGRSFIFRRHMAVHKKKRLSQPHLIWKKWCWKWLMLRAVLSKFESRGGSFNGVKLKWELIRAVSDRQIQESFEIVPWITSPACTSIRACHTETMAKESIDIHSTAFSSGGYLGCWPKWSEGKTFLQNYIKYCYSNRHVIVTDIATSAKDIVYFLSNFRIECKNIFLFNHPRYRTEAVAYDMVEGIKDGHKVSA